MAQGGVFLAPDVWLRSDGRMFMAINRPGLNDIDWEAVGDFSSDMFDKVIKFKAVSQQKPLPPVVPTAVPPAGMQLGGGAFGMDSTTLLMLAALGLLFFSMPRK